MHPARFNLAVRVTLAAGTLQHIHSPTQHIHTHTHSSMYYYTHLLTHDSDVQLLAPTHTGHSTEGVHTASRKGRQLCPAFRPPLPLPLCHTGLLPWHLPPGCSPPSRGCCSSPWFCCNPMWLAACVLGAGLSTASTYILSLCLASHALMIGQRMAWHNARYNARDTCMHAYMS